MPEIKDRESLQAWLETRPREEAIVIVARAALRALPESAALLSSTNTKESIPIALTVFRADSITFLIASGPDNIKKLRHKARELFSDLNIDPHIASTPYNTIICASEANKLDASTLSHTIVGAVESSSLMDDDDDYLDLDSYIFSWAAVSKDAEKLSKGMPYKLLISSRIWPENPTKQMDKDWATLRDTLLEHDTSWKVWTDWYQDRLDGKPIDEVLEIEKALIPDEDWEQGPAHVNAIIAELIWKHSKNPPETITILEWLGGNALRLALADWNLDQMDQFMQLVPFSNDYRDLP